jgi:hypothetical protein
MSDTLVSIFGWLCLAGLVIAFLVLMVVCYVALEKAGQERWRNMTDDDRENEMWAAFYLLNPNDPIWPKDPFGRR